MDGLEVQQQTVNVLFEAVALGHGCQYGLDFVSAHLSFQRCLIWVSHNQLAIVALTYNCVIVVDKCFLCLPL